MCKSYLTSLIQVDRYLSFLLFNFIKIDKDGHLSAKELEEMLNSFISDIKLCDSNEEVASFCALIFDHLDSDGNGTIEREGDLTLIIGQ